MLLLLATSKSDTYFSIPLKSHIDGLDTKCFFLKKIKNPEMLIITLVFGTGNCKHISNLQHQAPWLWEFSSCTRRPLEVRVITWKFNFWKWYFTSLPYSTGAFTVCSRLYTSFACSSVKATPSLVWLWSQGTCSPLFWFDVDFVLHAYSNYIIVASLVLWRPAAY